MFYDYIYNEHEIVIMYSMQLQLCLQYRRLIGTLLKGSLFCPQFKQKFQKRYSLSLKPVVFMEKVMIHISSDVDIVSSWAIVSSGRTRINIQWGKRGKDIFQRQNFQKKIIRCCCFVLFVCYVFWSAAPSGPSTGCKWSYKFMIFCTISRTSKFNYSNGS